MEKLNGGGPMLKAVVFDFNGIFAEPIEERVLGNICSRTGFGRWLAHSNYLALVQRFETGRMSPKEFWTRVFPGLNDAEYREYVEDEYERPFRTNQDAYSLARQLARRMQVHTLSNSNFLQGKACRKQGLYSPFQGLFLSHETHALKPFPSAYRNLLEKTGLEAGECAFVDDSLRNTIVAGILGFKAVRYRNNRQLVSELNRLGVV